MSLSSSVGSVRMGSSPFGTSPMGGFMPGSSPPVGSVPKSFPHFQHPSHALLEDNGFKQQKYAPISSAGSHCVILLTSAGKCTKSVVSFFLSFSPLCNVQKENLGIRLREAVCFH